MISQPELQGVKRISVPSQAPADVEQPPPVPPVPKPEPQQKVGTSDARKPLKTKPKAAPSIPEGSEYLTFCHVSFLNNPSFSVSETILSESFCTATSIYNSEVKLILHVQLCSEKRKRNPPASGPCQDTLAQAGGVDSQ
jgi:hypothetical protein